MIYKSRNNETQAQKLEIFGIRYMAKDHSDREETHCHYYMGYSFGLAARVLLYVYMHYSTYQLHQLWSTNWSEN